MAGLGRGGRDLGGVKVGVWDGMEWGFFMEVACWLHKDGEEA